MHELCDRRFGGYWSGSSAVWRSFSKQLYDLAIANCRHIVQYFITLMILLLVRYLSKMLDSERFKIAEITFKHSCRQTFDKPFSISNFSLPTVTASVAFYPRDAMLARVIAIATCLSVRLSVRLSVTRRYCVKTKKASGMFSSPSGSPKTLVFWRQISSPNSKGFPPNGSLKQGRSEKFSDFSALSVNISKTVADTAKVTISD